MEETNQAPVGVSQSQSELVGASQSQLNQSESVKTDGVNPLSPKNPMLYVGIGALIIIVLGLVFLFSKEKTLKDTSSGAEPTIEVTAQPTEAVSSDASGVVIQERTEAEAIQISDADSDLQDISQDLEEL